MEDACGRLAYTYDIAHPHAEGVMGCQLVARDRDTDLGLPLRVGYAGIRMIQRSAQSPCRAILTTSIDVPSTPYSAS